MEFVNFSEDETGEKMCCGICQSLADEGFMLSAKNNEEYEWLIYIFQDEANFCVNDCHVDLLREWCSEKGYDLKFGATPSDELVDSAIREAVGDLSSPLFKEISEEHEFYFVKKKNGDTLWGYLFDHTQWDVTLKGCHKLDSDGVGVPVGIPRRSIGEIEFRRSQSQWDRYFEASSHTVYIFTDDIIDIRKAPPNIPVTDHERSWRQRRDDEDAHDEVPLSEKKDLCKICNKPLLKHSFSEQEKCRLKQSGFDTGE